MLRRRGAGGGGRIRTYVGIRRQIYSLLPLTTRPPLRDRVPPGTAAARANKRFPLVCQHAELRCEAVLRDRVWPADRTHARAVDGRAIYRCADHRRESFATVTPAKTGVSTTPPRRGEGGSPALSRDRAGKSRPWARGWQQLGLWA